MDFNGHICTVDSSGKKSHYPHVEGVERLEKYQPGGYHPVMIGDVLHDRYRIIDKLGYGGWSTTWLAQDLRSSQWVAVKVGISDSRMHETRILRALAESTPVPGSDNPIVIPVPLDEFQVSGPNGTHPCYTMAVAQGSLGDASAFHLFSFEVLRALAAGLTLAVAHVHSRGFVHGGKSSSSTFACLVADSSCSKSDIHLRNVLAKAPLQLERLTVEELRQRYGTPKSFALSGTDDRPRPPNLPSEVTSSMPLCKKANEFTLADTHVMLSDFGEAFEPASETRLGIDCHTPLAFRPPEAYFLPDAPLSFSADIWSLGRAIWDLLGLQPVISSEFQSETEVACQYIDVLGQMPQEWWQGWEKGRGFFDKEQTRLDTDERVWESMKDAFEKGVQRWRREEDMGVFSEDEAAAILDLMRRMLCYKPQDRPSAQDILQSDWMVKWALPDYERAQNETTQRQES